LVVLRAMMLAATRLAMVCCLRRCWCRWRAVMVPLVMLTLPPDSAIAILVMLSEVALDEAPMAMVPYEAMAPAGAE
jgi:hypothetical protein